MEAGRGAKPTLGGGDSQEFFSRKTSTEIYDEANTVAAAAVAVAVAADGDSEAEQEIGQIADMVSFQTNHYPQYDRSKFSITTTPTLVDEISDDDEGDDDEMVSLERERLKRVSKLKDDAAAFKTNSLRRTPGAHAMRQSSGADVLGFGLALSSPIGTKEADTPRSTGLSPGSSLGASRQSLLSEKPPRDPKSAREFVSYTPASYVLSKNPLLGVSHGSFSPNTLRLTEDLDNLLDEGEETVAESDLPDEEKVASFSQSLEQIGGDEAETTKSDLTTESWTSPYIFPAEGGTGARKPKTQTRSHRSNSARQSRNLDSSKAFRPVEEEEEEEAVAAAETQKPLNFGGAFAAPQNFQRPVPSHETQGVLKPTPHARFESTAQQQFNHHAFVPHDPRLGSSYGYGIHYQLQQQQQQQPPIRLVALHSTNHGQHQQPTQQAQSIHQPWIQGAEPQASPHCSRPLHDGWKDAPYSYGVDHRISPTPGNAYHPFVQYQYWQDQRGSQNPSGAHALHRNQNVQSQTENSSGGYGANEFLSLDADREIAASKRRDRKGNKQQKRNPKNQQTRKTEKHRKEGLKKKIGQSGKKGGRGKKNETDPAESKKAELNESPVTRAAFKEFNRNFRMKERESFAEAEAYALDTLEDESFPAKVHWRVFLELADLAKRANRFEEARRLYLKVCELQPYASQGWLEYSKLEEECGNLKKCACILNDGLQYCELSENLLTRAIKHAEKMGNLSRARELLARLKHVGIEKVWRSVLEGALLEARAGNHLMARRVLKYLMHHVPWYGPLYLEAYRLERDLGCSVEALLIVEKGLKAIPRYGPLWFGAFRLCEGLDMSERASHLPRTHRMFERATMNMNRELIWKVHLEAAQIMERSASWCGERLPAGRVNLLLDPCRKRIAMTALSCPQNLLWKVWLSGGRVELSAGNTDRARLLFLRAHGAVPEKGRVTTVLECARLEEFVGETDLARAILCKCRQRHKSEWKVWLESVLVENRSGNPLRAVGLAQEALEFHSGTGRLWAALVQLRYAAGGERGQTASLRCALRAVPKSGEVWCEGGRILLNPFSRAFDLLQARRHLQFATRFTPQYGDSFLETLRLEFIERWVLPMASVAWEAVKGLSCQAENSDGWISEMVALSSKLILAVRSGGTTDEISIKIQDKSVVPSLRAQLERSDFADLLGSSDLELRCANADPNYGLLWFHCRRSPIDTARAVLQLAQIQVVNDLKENVHIYVAAIIRRYALTVATRRFAKSVGSEIGPGAGEQSLFSKLLESRLQEAPSTDLILRLEGLLDSSLSGSDFVTGLVELNRSGPITDQDLLERKKTLFGGDALFS